MFNWQQLLKRWQPKPRRTIEVKQLGIKKVVIVRKVKRVNIEVKEA